MPPKQSKTLKRGARVKLSLAVCISIWAGSAFGQALPTATEAFNLRIKCKELVDEKTQTMTEDFYRPKAPELEFFYSSSHYDARVNRCYGDFHYKQKFRIGPMKERESRSLFDMQIDDLVAFNKNEDGKKVGMVFDHSHQSTSNGNLGWDDADAFMNDMIEDKK